MIKSIMVTGIDEAIARAELAERLFLLYVGEQLRWFGETVTTAMKEGHPPGGPHPEDLMDAKMRAQQYRKRPTDRTKPVFGVHSYIDRTEQLTRSIGFTVEQWESHHCRVLVFAMAPYAQAVEEGTPHSRPYRFFWPNFYKYVPELQARLQTAVQRALAAAEDPRARH